MPTDQHFDDQATESQLRTLLAGDLTTPGGLDTGTIIRRSRRRRRAGTLAVVAASTLAIAGIGVVAIEGLGSPLPSTMTASDGMEESSTFGAENLDSPDTAGSGIAPAERLNPCGGETAEVAPNSAGLALSPAFPDTAPADGGEQQGTVALRNTGADRIRGTIVAPPAITIARDGVTVWHSPAPSAPQVMGIDLAPGESTNLDASYRPARCDERAGASGVGATPLPPGTYTVSAAIVFEPADGSAAQLVTGPALPLAIE